MVKSPDSFVSDEKYDGDNYVSIDSQLGKYDVNFKNMQNNKPKPRQSDDNIAI